MPEKPSKLLPAIYGGIIIGCISAIPVLNFVNCLCCAGVMFGGFMAVFLYKKDLPPAGPELTNSDALQLGALAGLFGALVGTVLNVILLVLIGNVAGEAMQGMLLNILGDKLPPEALQQMEESFAHSAELGLMSTLISFGTSLIIDPLFGLLGGLIGFNIYKPKAPQSPIQPPPMNPPAPSGGQ